MSEPQTKLTRVALDRIRIDATQTRAALDGDTVDEYAAAYQEGAQFPPVIQFADGPYLWMGDGFHRFAAARASGRTDIEAEIREGNQRDAILFAAGCNAAHGLRRTNADKQNTVRMILADSEWVQKSDRWIAEACRVSHPLVASVRATTGNSSSSNGQARQGRDGKTRKPRATGAGRAGTETDRRCHNCIRKYPQGGQTKGCEGCKAARKGRQPGEEETAKRGEKNGQPFYDLKEYAGIFGSLYRQPNRVLELYRIKETPQSEELERDLKAWDAKFRGWHSEVTKPVKAKE